MKITKGFLDTAKQIASPNVGGVIDPKFIVVHYTAGFTAASAISTLTNPASKVSAQFVVDRDGSITQLVSCERRAWHAGPSSFMGYSDLNSHSIGIEFVNPGYFLKGLGEQVRDPTSKQPIPSSKLAGYDLNMVATHPRLGGGPVVWPRYTDAQIEAGRNLIKAICEAYNILGLASHEEIDSRGWKTDPGPSFPIGEFKTLCDRFEGRAAGSPTPTGKKASVIASSLNVRTAPNGPIITTLKKGTSVNVIEDTGEWVRINAPNVSSGWVADQFLAHVA
jgi:N-acetylmuramoyl-L-alanine amidase